MAVSKLTDTLRNIDVICLSETFVKNGSEPNFKLNDYSMAAHFY